MPDSFLNWYGLNTIKVLHQVYSDGLDRGFTDQAPADCPSKFVTYSTKNLGKNKQKNKWDTFYFSFNSTQSFLNQAEFTFNKLQ